MPLRFGSPSLERARRGLVPAALATLAYGAVYLFLGPFPEQSAGWTTESYSGPVLGLTTVWLLYIVLGGWLLGRWGGLAFAVLQAPLHLALAWLARHDGWAQMGGFAGIVMIVVFTAFFSVMAGAVGDLYAQARERSAELKRKNDELVKATAALQRSEEMFREFAERIDVGVWIKPTGAEMFLNPAAKRIFDAHEREPTSAWLQRVDREDQDLLAASGRALARGEPQDVEFRLHAKGGATKWIRGRSFAVRDESGDIASYVGLAEDVTQIKEREMRRETIERRERLTALGTLVAGVAHEVNNPLTYVMGNMQIARGVVHEASERVANGVAPDPASLAKVERMLTTSIAGSERIARIVKALRAVTRQRSGADRETVHLNALAANVAELVKMSLPANVTLALDLAPSDPRVTGASAELHQVALNLVTNAVQAVGPMGGAVAIETRATPDGARLAVRDDGPGISVDARAKLFTPFFTTKPEGTGLGLSIVHAIVRDHGGEVEVESSPGRGATFTVRLPEVAA